MEKINVNVESKNGLTKLKKAELINIILRKDELEKNLRVELKEAKTELQNIYNVSIWTLFINTLVILYTFNLLDASKSGIQIIEKYSWLSSMKIDILLGADVFSMLLLLSINISFLIS